MKANGRFKAQLVIQGWSQKHGIDCGIIFAPVCRLESQRLLLDAAALKEYQAMVGEASSSWRSVKGLLLVSASSEQHVSSAYHLVAAKRILRYLRGSPNVPITYCRNNLELIEFSDSCVELEARTTCDLQQELCFSSPTDLHTSRHDFRRSQLQAQLKRNS